MVWCTSSHHDVNVLGSFQQSCWFIHERGWSLTQKQNQLWLWSSCCHKPEPHLNRKDKPGTCKCLWQHVTQLEMCCTGVNPDSFHCKAAPRSLYYTQTHEKESNKSHSLRVIMEKAFMWILGCGLGFFLSVGLGGCEVVVLVAAQSAAVKSILCGELGQINKLDL